MRMKNDLRKVRGNDITMIFQEPMTSLNPLHSVEKQIGEILSCTRVWRAAARERIISLLTRWAYAIRRDCRTIRTSFRRAAAARDDCHGAGQ